MAAVDRVLRVLISSSVAVLLLLALAQSSRAGELSPDPFPIAAADQLFAAAAAPAGFEETVALSGLTNPTAVRFAPDGRIFVAEKDGLVKVFDNFADATPTVLADLRTQVQNFWDRGLLGLALDPNFTTNGFVYVLYTRDEEPFNTTMPRWGDTCPTPPGATADGCLVTGTLSRLDSSGNETKLIAKDWCQQYPSHSVGSLAFGADGMLYVSGGEGASFNFADYGQDGNPVNPCGDPPGAVGANLTPPTAEGGAMRSQDLRTSGDPTGLDGSILRLDPATGGAAPGNPLIGSADPNARRIVAQGLRNPFRITVRPGTNELWLGDVGSGTWEEIDRIANPTAGVTNFGWPCYEGPSREGGYDSLNVNICENLYAAGPGAVAQPYFTYNHGAKVVPGESCPTGGSSISGLAFYTTGPFPDSYDGALFFSDYTRGCIWVMYKGANGLPDPSTIQTFGSGNIGPVDLQVGPDGALYYADLDKGTIERIRWPNNSPTARASATPTSGDVPLTVNFDGSASSDPDPGDTLTYAWDLDGDGAFNDSTAAKPVFTYMTRGLYTVRLRVTDPKGVTDVTSLTITAGMPPSATIDTPGAGATWQVGTVFNYSGSARDGAGNPIPANGLSWQWNQRHCSRLDASNCHTHVIETVSGVASGSFTAPDHEYPSYLELQLTATDANGLKTTVTRRLDPRTVDLTFDSNPAGLQLGVNTDAVTGPTTRTVIVGSSNSLSAPSPQTLGASSYAFSSWSDGGAASHTITAPATATTYRATFAVAGASGLVAAYGFDEGSGATAGDSSGGGNTGALGGGALWSTSGRFGNAVSFDGVNDLVNVPDSNSLDLTSGMTLEAWVNPSALGGWRSTVLKERPGGLAYALYADGDAGPSSYVWIGGELGVVGTTPLAAGTWAHLATTYDGTTQRVFLNGTQIGSRAQTGAIGTSTGALRIGGNTVWGEWFAGRIDEVRVYNRALAAAEITADMGKAVGPQPDPVLAVTPTSLSFTGGEGAPDPTAKTVSVSNTTGGALNYTTSSSASWLGVSPASGSAPGTVTVAPHTAGLTAGAYTGTVTIAAPGAQGSPKSVSVTLTVSPPPPPALAVSPASLTFNATVGGANPAAQNLSVTNTGSGSMSWTASDDASWLTISPATGTAPGSPGAAVNVTGLATGTYTATITVAATGATGSPKAVPVTLNVTAPSTGLVAAYGFNEGSGATVADSSGRGNNGTVGGGAAWSTAGKVGNALSFDGVNDMVTVPDANSLDLTNGMTIEAWVNASALGGWRTVLLKERTGGLVYSLYASGDTLQPSSYLFIGSAERSLRGSTPPATGAWAHLAATYDGATQRIYLNGTQIGSRAQTGSMTASTGALRIGGNNVWGEWFAGRIDEVRIYNRALSAAEINSDMNGSLG